MKKFLLILMCQIIAICTFAQHPTAGKTPTQPYVITPINMRLNVVNSILLNTVTGELYFVEVRMDADKTIVIKYEGGPCEDIANSYEGRFSISYDPKAEIYQVILIDHKLGRLWQTKGGKKSTILLPVFTPTE